MVFRKKRQKENFQSCSSASKALMRMLSPSLPGRPTQLPPRREKVPGFARLTQFSQYRLCFFIESSLEFLPISVKGHLGFFSSFWVSGKLHEVLGQIASCCAWRTDWPQAGFTTAPSLPAPRRVPSPLGSASPLTSTSRLPGLALLSSKARLHAVRIHSDFGASCQQPGSSYFPCL